VKMPRLQKMSPHQNQKLDRERKQPKNIKPKVDSEKLWTTDDDKPLARVNNRDIVQRGLIQSVVFTYVDLN